MVARESESQTPIGGAKDNRHKRKMKPKASPTDPNEAIHVGATTRASSKGFVQDEEAAMTGFGGTREPEVVYSSAPPPPPQVHYPKPAVAPYPLQQHQAPFQHQQAASQQHIVSYQPPVKTPMATPPAVTTVVATAVPNVHPSQKGTTLHANFGRTPESFVCIACHEGIRTKVHNEVGWVTVVFFILLLLLFWPLCWIPFVCKSCKSSHHYCPKCNAKLGVTGPCNG